MLDNVDLTSFSYNDIRGQRTENLPRTRPRIVTASANVNPLDDLILVDATSGAVTMTLETAVGCDGRRHIIKKSDSSGNAVTVACTGSQTIDGAATVSLAAQYETLFVMSNGTNWEAVSQYPPGGGGGGGSASFTAATITLPYAGAQYAEATVVDAAITATDKILIDWGMFTDADENTADMDDVKFSAVPAAGSMVVRVSTVDPQTKLGGAYKIMYLRG